MTDVAFTIADDGGSIFVENGTIELDSGLEASVVLSLFGGNEEDSGMDGDARKQWWGNLSETDPSKQYRSETQRLLAAMPIISGNLRRAEDAADRDLAWMVPSVATAVSVSAGMPGVNTIQLDVAVEIDGRREMYSFTRSGRSSA